MGNTCTNECMGILVYIAWSLFKQPGIMTGSKLLNRQDLLSYITGQVIHVNGGEVVGG
jgi:hypothetical protein